MGISELYQEKILEHYQDPHNFGELENAFLSLEAENPVCGDFIKLMIILDKAKRIKNIKFKGEGCAISIASASMMTDQIKGKTIEQAEKILFNFVNGMKMDLPQDILNNYKELTILQAVKKYPLRVKCALLAWHTLEEIIEKLKKLD